LVSVADFNRSASTFEQRPRRASTTPQGFGLARTKRFPVREVRSCADLSFILTGVAGIVE